MAEYYTPSERFIGLTNTITLREILRTIIDPNFDSPTQRTIDIYGHYDSDSTRTGNNAVWNLITEPGLSRFYINSAKLDLETVEKTHVEYDQGVPPDTFVRKFANSTSTRIIGSITGDLHPVANNTDPMPNIESRKNLEWALDSDLRIDRNQGQTSVELITSWIYRDV